MSRKHPGSKYHAAIPARAWAVVRLAVLDAANWQCANCGRYANEVDHVVPLFRGGDALDVGNLQALCGGPGGCHAAKTKAERGEEPVEGAEAWTAMVKSLVLAPVPPQAAHRTVEVLLRQPAGNDHGGKQVDPAP